jgi:signal transduction histidine kinase
MRVKLVHKLLALMLLTGAAPLAVVSLLLITIGRGQVSSTVEHVHRLEADAAATRVRDLLDRAEERLRGDFESAIDSMSDAEIATWLVYVLQKPDNIFTLRQVALHDSVGQRIGEPVRVPAESIPAEHRDRYLVREADVAEFLGRAPVAEAMSSREARVSSVYVSEARREALVALSLPITDRLGQLKWVVCGELSLRDVQRIVSDVTIGSVGHAYLVDAEGRAVAHPQFDLVLSRASLTGNGIVEQAIAAHGAQALAFDDVDGEPQLGAHSPVLFEGWRLIVEQPARDAYRPVEEMKTRAAFVLAIALAATLACGVLWVRSVNGPLRRVVDGMRRIRDGNFSHRLEISTRDEIGELAESFNVMGRMLERGKREIEAWNRELQDRVDAKTRALEEAQAQLIQSAKLSSVGQLGAGVAHELNNPLAGIVGQAALLNRRLKKADLDEEERAKLLGYVEHVQAESSRCREIIHGLLSYAQAAGGGGTADMDLNASLEKLLVLVDNNARSQGIELVAQLDPSLPSIRNNEQQVQQVVMHVVTNALQAMAETGTLTVRTRAVAEGVAIDVSDTGRGIAAEHLDRVFEPFFTTKDVWESTGLGLAVCYSIVEAHGGRIEVESELGRGSTFTVVLPLRSAKADRGDRTGEEPVGLSRRRPAPASA